jgi:hypothetical protein
MLGRKTESFILCNTFDLKPNLCTLPSYLLQDVVAYLSVRSHASLDQLLFQFNAQLFWLTTILPTV